MTPGRASRQRMAAWSRGSSLRSLVMVVFSRRRWLTSNGRATLFATRLAYAAAFLDTCSDPLHQLNPRRLLATPLRDCQGIVPADFQHQQPTGRVPPRELIPGDPLSTRHVEEP